MRPKSLRAFLGLAAAAAILAAGAAPTKDDPFARDRAQMVKEIESPSFGRTAVKDKSVLDAMRAVPRHLFVPDGMKGRAYDDTPLPIGYGQTISQPYVVASMTELLAPKPDHVSLEIGTGSGYQAAVLAKLVKQVYTIEIVPELADAAGDRLKRLDFGNVEVRTGDGYFGWSDHAPFDSIIVTAAASHIPPPLIEQLKPGGRMVIPVGPPLQVQQLILVHKGTDGKVRQRSLMPVRFVPLTGGRS